MTEAQGIIITVALIAVTITVASLIHGARENRRRIYRSELQIGRLKERLFELERRNRKKRESR